MDIKDYSKGLRGSKVAVTGATGFIGRSLLSRLIDCGAETEILIRGEGKSALMEGENVRALIGDLNGDFNGFTIAPEVVFHLAGEIKDRTVFEETNYRGTLRLIEGLDIGKLKKFVFLSSVGVTGAVKGGTYDEDSLEEPRNDYEKSKLNAETAVLVAVKEKGLPAVILRPSIVFGEGKTDDWMMSLICSVDGGRFAYVGSPENIFNLVYVEDVVDALLFLASDESVTEERVFIINDPLSWDTFISTLGEQLGRRMSFSTIPFPIAITAGVLCDTLRLAGIDIPFSLTRCRALGSKVVFSSDRIKEHGFSLGHGNTRGIEKVVREYVLKNGARRK